MDDVILAQWLIDKRHEVEAEIDLLSEQADPKQLPLFRALLKVNNSLVEAFWELMIYREHMGLTPLAHPHY